MPCGPGGSSGELKSWVANSKQPEESSNDPGFEAARARRPAYRVQEMAQAGTSSITRKQADTARVFRGDDDR